MLHTEYQFRHYRQGRLIWASDMGDIPGVDKDSRLDRALRKVQPWLPNELLDEGEQAMLDVYYRGAAGPSNFFLRAYDLGAASDTITLATISANEAVGTGYPGTNTIERSATGFPTLSLQSGDYRADSKTITWTNSGGGAWTMVDAVILATVQTGTAGLAVARRDLNSARTLQPSDQLQSSIRISLA